MTLAEAKRIKRNSFLYIIILVVIVNINATYNDGGQKNFIPFGLRLVIDAKESVNTRSRLTEQPEQPKPVHVRWEHILPKPTKFAARNKEQ